MEMRTATPADWPRIIEIYNHAVSDGQCTADVELQTVESRRGWLQQHTDVRYPIRLVQENGEIVGWCSLSPYRPGRKALAGVAEISYYIDRDYRGMGIGNRLLADAIAYATKHDFKHLIAILLDTNIASLKLLRKFHFQQWGKLPGIVDFGSSVCGQYIYGKALSPGLGTPASIATIL